ncbi:Uncharacterised protein [Mycobacteroides abscessus subsp. abscessus]|uniref:hypothetical protein n=1 Tax=Mycobacteroides abscessus TaxID=36809 RepID=UPI000926200A|nr:hypothetical protein [Mycobacteroides abscessus]SID68940.1 Uncharacterised protein [Mycobacteroides abscessus subsp. abscessus]SIF77604.1 Uncharacterised protein [Mycobacteroides abscessus subsp. abscessus]SIG16099.1 Uncharacterised protein [Mycobacteroides abscessus subsp. abscessus]SIH63429.1 Uncharacterised protein [Mycobacteroides abscessus subsp. abscessus]
MTENDDNTCEVCGKPLDAEEGARRAWYPTAPWMPEMGGAGRPEMRVKLTEALDDMGVEYTIEPA